MKKVMFIAAIIGGLITVGATPALATPQEKVTICHRTNSDSNPYVLITVNANAVDGEGQNDHTHHIVDENHTRADIIPAPSVTVGDEEIFFCPGPEGPEGPEGPQGSPGEDGEDGTDGVDGVDGEDGVDGRTPITLCWPGLGVGFTFAGEPIPDGAHILGTGAICPLVGAIGPTGPVGSVGPVGPAGTSVSSVTTVTEPTPEPAGELAKTGFGNWLWIAGAALLLSGVMMSLLTGRRSNA